MPGLGTITPRSDGDTVTAAIYNGDRQEIINTMEPLLIDDYSANLAQMQTMTDPGDEGSESLATTLAGELARIRYVLKNLKLTDQWYSPTRERTVQVDFVTSANANGGVLPHGETTTVTSVWRVSGDYVEGDVQFYYTHRANGTTGNFKITHEVFRFRDSEPLDMLLSTDASGGAADTDSHTTGVIIAEEDFVAGDWLRLTVTRIGGDAADTNLDPWTIDGFAVVYTSSGGG